MKPRVLIVGTGETGSHLAARLRGNWEVSVVDITPAALEQERLAEIEHRHAGDGTSALVLRQAGADQVSTLVACTGLDEINLEVLRLARQTFAIESLYAIMYSSEWEQRYEIIGADVVMRHVSCSALLASRLEGRKVATGIGLGEGEIMEVEVLANSSVIGHRLAELSPRRWLVGAIYRDGNLIVPHGDTVIQQGDRVLIIGEPEILSAIATHISTGESEFPLHYGTKIVLLDSPGITNLLEEAHYLLSHTAASQMELIAREGFTPNQALVSCCEQAGFALESVTTADASPTGLADQAALRDVGLLVLEPERLSFLHGIGLGRSRVARFIDLLSSPVLVARGTIPYERVLLVLAELPFSLEAAQLAIDLVRMIGSQLHLGVVHQPELVVGPQMREEMEQKRRQIEKLCSMYHVPIKLVEMEGNPIQEVVRQSDHFNLVVLPFWRRRRASLTRPDVGQNLLHQVRCSALVMPV